MMTAVLMAGLLALTSACDSKGGTGPNDGTGLMTARIDGQAFSALVASVERAGGNVYVNGGGAGQRAIGFTFPDQGTGTYTIEPGVLVAAGVSIGNQHWVAGQDIGGGSINVTTLTGSRAAGTFSFTVVESTTLSITEGVFDIGS